MRLDDLDGDVSEGLKLLELIEGELDLLSGEDWVEVGDDDVPGLVEDDFGDGLSELFVLESLDYPP